MGSIFAAMRRCQLFDGIPEEKYQNVLNCLHGEVRAIPKDTILLRIGDCQKRPGVVMSGTLRISLYSEDGNLLTIDRLSRGRVFGETLVCSMSQDSPIQIDALNDTEVLYLDFDPLLLQQENGCPYRMRVTANLLQEMEEELYSSTRKCVFWHRTGFAIGLRSIFKVCQLPPMVRYAWRWDVERWRTICV